MAPKTLYYSDIHPRPALARGWERIRNKKEFHWVAESVAEMLGVFFYVYLGLGSVAGWIVGNILQQPGLSSILQIGFAYAFGIAFAIMVCSSTSGGHFNPCVTVSLVVFRGFPPLKGLRYIISQTIGAYIACALIYNQWYVLIKQAESVLVQAGTYAQTQFTPLGPAGIFALYLLPQTQTIPRVLLNEFVTDFFLGLIIWGALDPSNIFLPPAVGPIAVGLAYAGAIWGYATPSIALNTARDVGGRMFAMTIWGMEASGGKYAAIAALVNIPATLLAAFVYELFLTDSDRVIPKPQLEFVRVQLNHRRASAPEPRKSASEKPPHEALENLKPSLEIRERAEEVRIRLETPR